MSADFEFPRFFITLVIMDPPAANPFGHAFLMLSKQETPEAPIKVEDAVGLYSQPRRHHLFFNNISLLLNLFKGVKSTCKQEHMRELDSTALRGQTFSVEPQKYQRVLMKLRKDQNDPAQLKSLAINIRPSLRNGLDTSQSYTCKTYALNTLLEEDIISPDQHGLLCGQKAFQAFPRFNNLKFPPIRLVSTGIPTPHTSKNKNITYYNRLWENNDLYWATPPLVNKTEKSIVVQTKKIDLILNEVRQLELQILRKIAKLDVSSDTEKEKNKKLLENNLREIQSLYEKFKNAKKNTNPDDFNKQLSEARIAATAAKIALASLEPNYAFLLKACQSSLTQQSLLAATGVVLALLLCSGIAQIAIAGSCGLYGGWQIIRFFKKEKPILCYHLPEMQPEITPQPST